MSENNGSGVPMTTDSGQESAEEGWELALFWGKVRRRYLGLGDATRFEPNGDDRINAKRQDNGSVEDELTCVEHTD